MKICITSLKFSPGHVSHMLAYANLFKELGFDIEFYLESGYKVFNQDLHQFNCLFQNETSNLKCDIIFFCNVSLYNHLIAAKLKKQETKIVYLYHEPYDGLKNYIKEGFKQALKTIIAHFISIKLIKLSDLVIIPSNYALKMYKSNEIRYCDNYIVVPLLFNDECGNKINLNDKKYFSYIGHAVRGHGFDKYIEFVKLSFKMGSGYKFQIATRNNIKDLINKDKILIKMKENESLKIIHGRALKSDEINEAYRTSYCIWNLYRRSTQSGVLPKAYMFGTPVLAKRIGSFPEYLVDGKTGYFVDSYDRIKIMDKLALINANLLNMSKESRNIFIKTFYWKSNIEKMEIAMNKIL